MTCLKESEKSACVKVARKNQFILALVEEKVMDYVIIITKN